MFSLSCPSCGAPVTFATQTTGYAVCASCRSVLVRRDLDVEKVGVTAGVQEDGTPLQIGTTGTYDGCGFQVVGRIQVAYPSGWWNEWYVQYDNGSDGWIGESQGTYFVSSRVLDAGEVPAFATIERGQIVPLRGQVLAVTQVESARVEACEGSLPFYQPDGYDAPLVDLRSTTSRGATIDYSEDPPFVFVGDYVEFDALALANLREIEGWTS